MSFRVTIRIYSRTWAADHWYGIMIDTMPEIFSSVKLNFQKRIDWHQMSSYLVGRLEQLVILLTTLLFFSFIEHVKNKN